MDNSSLNESLTIPNVSAPIRVGDLDPDPHLFGPPDPDLNPLVRGTDPDPDPSLFS